MSFGDFGDLNAILQTWAVEHRDRRMFTFLEDGDSAESVLTYGDLDRQARQLAARLQRVAAPGDRAVLLVPPGLDYLVAFFACLYAGVVAVTVYPPDPRRAERTLPRFMHVVTDSQATVLLTDAVIHGFREPMTKLAPDLGRAHWLSIDDDEVPDADDWQPVPVSSETLAFLQYTSGSTGNPKGVMVSHGNLLANARMIEQAMGLSPDDVIVSWVPLYHDMGLIGSVIQPVITRLRAVIMSPLDFLQRPLLWLRAITRYAGTIGTAPNFAYDLCARRIRPEEKAELDLSSWRVALNGSEPIRWESMARFAEAFGAHGFSKRAFFPAFGIAEATLFVSSPAWQADPTFCGFSVADLQSGKATLAGPEQPCVQLVSCGRSPSGGTIIIVDPEAGIPVTEGTVGEIWVGGPHIAQGYWQRLEESERTFRARPAGEETDSYLRTGDLGFLRDGEVFIAGRLKDLIIVRGRNYYPQDIEYAVERAHPAFRPGCSAAFSVADGDGERVVVVAEIRLRHHQMPAAESTPGGERRRSPGRGAHTPSPDRTSGFDALAIMAEVRNAVARALDLLVHDVVLVRPGSIPKTSSGKIRRHACRDDYRTGSLAVTAQWLGTAPEAGPVVPRDLTDLGGDRDRWLSYLQAHIAAQLGCAIGTIDGTVPVAELGLDSLAATQVLSRLTQELGITVPFATVFQAPSLAHLADHLAGLDVGQAEPGSPLPGEGGMAVEQLSAEEVEGLFELLGLERDTAQPGGMPE